MTSSSKANTIKSKSTSQTSLKAHMEAKERGKKDSGKQKQAEKQTETINNDAASLAMDVDKDDDPIIVEDSPGTEKEQGSATKKRKTDYRAAVMANPYKKVNHKSINRRECLRNSVDDTSIATPEVNNKGNFRSNQFSTRIGLKLAIPASAEPLAAVQKALKSMLKQIWEADPKACIIPWRENDQGMRRICKEEDIPTELEELKKYLSRFWTPKPNKEGKQYPFLWLGHDEPLRDINLKIQPWLRQTGQGVYRHNLQCEDWSEIGWFLYSDRDMDIGALMDEIEEMLKVRVSLRWKMIATSTKGNIPQANQVFALVVEADTQSRLDAQTILLGYYMRKIQPPSYYPNGIAMRFIKHKDDALDFTEKKKIEKARTRQRIFLSRLAKISTQSILLLDLFQRTQSVKEGPTLRQMIMSLMRKDGRKPLFHSVDLDWRQSAFIFLFDPRVRDEAEVVIKTLLPRLKALFPDQVESLELYFTQETVNAAKIQTYNIQKDRIVIEGLEDEENEDEDEDDGFAFGNLVKDASEEKKERPAIPEIISPGFPGDDDSISTLHADIPKAYAKTFNPSPSQTGTPASIITPKGKSRNVNSSNDNMSIGSNTSSVTMGTIQTVRTLKTQIEYMEDRAKNTDAKVDTILQMLSSMQTSKPAVRDGQPAACSIASDGSDQRKNQNHAGEGLR